MTKKTTARETVIPSPPMSGELWEVDREWVLPRLRGVTPDPRSSADPPCALILGGAPSNPFTWISSDLSSDGEVVDALIDGEVHSLHRSWFRKRISL